MPVFIAVAYARYSSDKQQESSIIVQLAAIKQFCQRHNIQLINEYIDEAQTGKTADRIAFQQLVNDAKKQNFQYIIVHRMDRWARNVDDARFYKKYFKKYGIKVISAIEEFDDSPEGEFFELISLGIAEMYSKKLSREAKAGVMANAREGKPHGGTPPIGYAVKDKRYVIVEEEAKAVKLMFEMTVEGYGYTTIMRYLNSNGYRRANGKLYTNNIHDLLRNRQYTGEYIFNKGAYRARNAPYNSHKERNESEIIRIPHAMPQIISYELFNKVQAILDARKKKPGMIISRATYLLTGLCQCAICGKTINGGIMGTEGHKHRVYSCKNRRSGFICKDINSDYLEEYVISLISNCLLLPRNSEKLLNLLKVCYLKTTDEYKQKSDDMKEKIKKINSKIDEHNSLFETDKPLKGIIESNINQLNVEKSDVLYEKSIIDSNLEMIPEFNIRTVTQQSREIRGLIESDNLTNQKCGLSKIIQSININNDYVKTIFNFQDFISCAFPLFITVIERRDFIARAENHYRRALAFPLLNIYVGEDKIGL